MHRPECFTLSGKQAPIAFSHQFQLRLHECEEVSKRVVCEENTVKFAELREVDVLQYFMAKGRLRVNLEVFLQHVNR